VYGQPIAVHVNETTAHSNDDGFTISQAQRIDTFAGYHVDEEKSPCIAFLNLFSPHTDAVQVGTSRIELTGTANGGAYAALPIAPTINQWLNGDENFTWFDTFLDGLDQSTTFNELIFIEPVFDFAAGTLISFDGGRYRGEVNSTDVLILPLNPLVDNTFTNPILYRDWGRPGDINGDYRITVQDINAIETSDYDPYVDWTNTGSNGKDDMILACSAGGIVPGDANLDGIVDAQDLNEVGKNWGLSIPFWQFGDFDRNGVIGAGDLNIIGLYWRDTQQTIWEAMSESPYF